MSSFDRDSSSRPNSSPLYSGPYTSAPFTAYPSSGFSSPSTIPYTQQNPSSIERPSEFGPNYGSSSSPSNTATPSYGSLFDRPMNTSASYDNYKQSSNTDFDSYKPAYLNSIDNPRTSTTSSYDPQTPKLQGGAWNPNATNNIAPMNYLGQTNEPVAQDKYGDKANVPKAGNSVLDPENIRYYHMFNLRKVPYKLKNYLYYSEDMNMNFDIINYNRMDVKMGRPPILKHYLRFYDIKYDHELNPRGKYYGDMYTLTDANNTSKIVYSKEYQGKYANQLDYINFKVFMTQEKYH